MTEKKIGWITRAGGAEWHVPPECGGQIVERSYALAEDPRGIPCVILERIEDRALTPGDPRRVRIFAYSGGSDAGFEPWNGRPALGEEIGEVVIDDDGGVWLL